MVKQARWLTLQFQMFHNNTVTLEWLTAYRLVLLNLPVPVLDEADEEDDNDPNPNPVLQNNNNNIINFNAVVAELRQEDVLHFNQRQTMNKVNDNGDELLEMIRSATFIIAAAMTFNDPFTELLIERHVAGIPVLVITSSLQRAEHITRLRDAGILVIVLNRFLMHVKMLILDGHASGLFGGCANMTMQAIRCNYGEFLVYYAENNNNNEINENNQDIKSAGIYFSLAMIKYYFQDRIQIDFDFY
jgi:hypothetical protein